MLSGKCDLSARNIKTYGNKVTNRISIREESKLLNRKYNLIILIGDQTIMDKVGRLHCMLSEFQIQPSLLDIFVRSNS